MKRRAETFRIEKKLLGRRDEDFCDLRRARLLKQRRKDSNESYIKASWQIEICRTSRCYLLPHAPKLKILNGRYFR